MSANNVQEPDLYIYIYIKVMALRDVNYSVVIYWLGLCHHVKLGQWKT